MKVLNSLFLAALDLFLYDWPSVSCNSWGRSFAHNLAEKGAPKSEHLTWTAVDLLPDNPAKLPAMARRAQELGFMGIELDFSNNHLHLDWRTTVWHVVKTKDGQWQPLENFLTKEGSNHDAQV